MPDNRIYGIRRFGEGPESFDRRMAKELRQMSNRVGDFDFDDHQTIRVYIAGLERELARAIRLLRETKHRGTVFDYAGWMLRRDALLAEHPELGKDNGNG